MRVLVSNQVDDDDIFLIDSGRAGYIARKNGVETFDSRISGAVAFEVIGAHMYDVSLIQPKAVYRIEENSA